MVERQLRHLAAGPEPHSDRNILQQRSATEWRDSAFGWVQRQRKLISGSMTEDLKLKLIAALHFRSGLAHPLLNAFVVGSRRVLNRLSRWPIEKGDYPNRTLSIHLRMI